MTETAETRIKRVRMRAWRRGMKEMDLILGPFADAYAAGMDSGALDLLERLMAENDQDLYRWITTGAGVPPPYGALIARIGGVARSRPGSDPAVQILVVFGHQRLQQIKRRAVHPGHLGIGKGTKDQIHLFHPAPPGPQSDPLDPRIRRFHHSRPVHA